MKKGRSTLFLLAGILVLGAFIGIQEAWIARVPSKEYRLIRLFDLHPESLISLQLESTNLTVMCVCENGVWVTGGDETRLGSADIALLQRLVDDLNSIGKEITISPENLKMRGVNSSEYGFEQPTLRLTAVDNRGEHDWLVGRATPLGNTVYVKEAGKEEIYTVSDRLLKVIPTEADQLRNRTLFAGKLSGARRVEIRGEAGFIQIVNDSKSGWQIQQPIVALADQKIVDEFLAKLYKLRVEEFIAENVSDLSVYGLQEESRQISLGGVDGTSRMLVLGDEIPDRKGKVYARRADDISVFALDANVLELLKVKHDDFRDVRVLTLPAKDISYISIERGTDQLELVFGESGRWSVTKPVAWNADFPAVANLLQFWDHAVITDFNVPASRKEAEWILRFSNPDGSSTNIIEVLPLDGREDGLFIRRDGEPAVYQINLPYVPPLMVDHLQYKNRVIWNLQKKDVHKIAIEKAGLSKQVIERQSDETFLPLEEHSNLPLDEPAVETMLNGLASISTSGYVVYNPRDLSIYGLDTPSLELHISLAGTNQLGQVLLVGSEIPEGYYGMVKGRDVVFMLDKNLVTLLSTDLIAGPEEEAPSTE